MKKHYQLGLLMLLVITTARAQDQNVIASQGDSYTNASNTIDYTIGETVIETVSNGNNDLTQGFHQTNLTVSVIEGIGDNDLNIAVSVFPNPASTLLTVQADQFEHLTYSIHSVGGSLLESNKFTSGTISINVEGYARGTYLLTLNQSKSGKTKTYQIIKQ